MKKDYLEVILEDMNSKFDLILEGHAALDSKIDRKFDELSEKIDNNSFKIDVLNKKIDGVAADLKQTDKRLSDKIDAVDEKLSKKIDAVASDLKAHRQDTEAHGGMYCVKES